MDCLVHRDPWDLKEIGDSMEVLAFRVIQDDQEKGVWMDGPVLLMYNTTLDRCWSDTVSLLQFHFVDRENRNCGMDTRSYI